MLKVAIRADGGLGIGMGHIFRCLTIATELKRRGHIAVFISSLAYGIKKVQEYGFDCIKIHPDEEHPEKREVLEILKFHEVDVLIVDSYLVEKEYMESLNQHVKALVYIDDLNRFPYPVDVLVHGSILGDYRRYERFSEDQTILTGLTYNLLREEFRGLPKREVREKAQSILLISGGTDEKHSTMRILELLEGDADLKKFELNVIVGQSNSGLPEIRTFASRLPSCTIHENINYISKVMTSCDIAITAGGGTIYELFACGTPVISFITAENQEFIVQKLQEKGYLVNLGWYHMLNENNLKFAIQSLSKDYSKRKQLSQITQRLIDGRGVERVVNALERFDKK